MIQYPSQLYGCLPCRPGTYLNYASAGESCYACSTGTVSLSEGASRCEACPVGGYPLSTTVCSLCDVGNFSADGMGCTECMPGTSTSVQGSAACSPCAQGYYQDMHGQSTCKKCSIGTFSNSSGNTVCFSCSINSNTFNTREGQSYCTPKMISCEIGQYMQRSESPTQDHVCVLCTPCASHQLTIILNKITGIGDLILYDSEQISLYSSQVCNGYSDAPFYQCVDNIPRAGEYLSFDSRVGASGTGATVVVVPYDFRQCQSNKYNDKLVAWVTGMDITQCYVSCLYGIVNGSLRPYYLKYSGNNQNIEDAGNNLFLERMLDDIDTTCLPCPLRGTCPRGRFRPRGTHDFDCGPTCGIAPFCTPEETLTGCTGYCTNAPPNSDYVAGTEVLDSNTCPWICNRGWHISDDKASCLPCPQASDAAALCGSSEFVVVPVEQCSFWHTSKDLCKSCPSTPNGRILGWDPLIEQCSYQCFTGYFLKDFVECLSCTSVNASACPIGMYLDQESCFSFGQMPVCKPCIANPSITFISNGGLNATKCKGICAPGFHTITKSTGIYFTSMSDMQLLPYSNDVQCIQCMPNDGRSCLRDNSSTCFEGYYRNLSVHADQVGSCVPCRRLCAGSQYASLCTGNEIVDASCVACPEALLKESTQQYTTKQFISYTDMASLTGQAQLQVISRDYCPRVCLNNFIRDPSNIEDCITCKTTAFALQRTIDPSKISSDNQCIPIGTPPCSFIFSHWNATAASPWWDTSQTRDTQRAGICWPCPDGTSTSVNDKDLCAFIPGYISPNMVLPVSIDPIPSLPADVSMVWKTNPIFNAISKKKKVARRLLVDLSNISISNSNAIVTHAKPCPHGYYKPSAGEGQCFACPLGSSTVSEGSVSKESCMCKYGYYRTTGHFCLPCPVDTYGNASISVMATLKTKERNATEWQNQCTSCPSNQTTYDNEGSTNCACALGMFLDSQSRECVSCPINYYCKPCDNAECLGITLYPCFPDATSPMGSYDILNCSCKLGMVKKIRPRNPSQIYCQKIPMGGEVHPITGEIFCKRGWTVISKAVDGSVAECALCSLGHYASTTSLQNVILTSTDQPLCTPCPKGFYISSRYGIGIQSCTACPSNQTTLTTGATSLQECSCPHSMRKDPIRGLCIGCTPTQYVDPLNSSLCKECPVNSIAETGANSPSRCMCNAGYYAMVTSMENIRCVLCPVGTFSAYASTTGDCTTCPEGSSTYRSGSTRLSNCGENQDLCKNGYSWRMGVGCFKTA